MFDLIQNHLSAPSKVYEDDAVNKLPTHSFTVLYTHVAVCFAGRHVSCHGVLFLVCPCERVVGATPRRRSFTTALLWYLHTARIVLWCLSLFHTRRRR